ncbi:MAG TPA: hypothetical protein VKG45_16645 [Actinomycetes bacterium]|nr:hypothetical protein [Actinomycetes bacterium]
MVDAHPPDGECAALRPPGPAAPAPRSSSRPRALPVALALAVWLAGALFTAAALRTPSAAALSERATPGGTRPAVGAGLASVGVVASAAAGAEREALREAVPLPVGAASRMAPPVTITGTPGLPAHGGAAHLLTGGVLPILAGLLLLGAAARALLADRGRTRHASARRP